MLFSYIQKNRVNDWSIITYAIC